MLRDYIYEVKVRAVETAEKRRRRLQTGKAYKASSSGAETAEEQRHLFGIARASEVRRRTCTKLGVVDVQLFEEVMSYYRQQVYRPRYVLCMPMHCSIGIYSLVDDNLNKDCAISELV